MCLYKNFSHLTNRSIFANEKLVLGKLTWKEIIVIINVCYIYGCQSS